MHQFVIKPKKLSFPTFCLKTPIQSFSKKKLSLSAAITSCKNSDMFHVLTFHKP